MKELKIALEKASVKEGINITVSELEKRYKNMLSIKTQILSLDLIS